MQLLVSVANGEEAAAACSGGADIVDAKDPTNGALGAVSLDTLRDIHAAVGGTRLVTAALGDAVDEGAIESLTREYAAIGPSFVKVGFAGTASARRVAALIEAAVRGARHGHPGRCSVVAVAYADAELEASLAPNNLVDVAARAGATGVLLDTANKSGPGLSRLMSPRGVAAYVSRAQGAGLLVALAGRLTLEDLPWVADCGADIAGVRGAACENGRTGRVTAARVQRLRAQVVASARLAVRRVDQR